MSRKEAENSEESKSSDRFPLEIDTENRSYNVFERNVKCSSEALKVFHRSSESILERDPELYNIWIDDHRFYSHGIIEVIENELNSLHQKCLQNNLRPLHGFRWLEGLLLVIGSYSKYLKELNDNDRLDAVLNLFYAAWITFFIHNRYAILQLAIPAIQNNSNNNDENHKTTERKSSHLPKSDEQIVRHLEKHLPNFDRTLIEAIDLGHQLTSKRLANLDKLEELHSLWKNPKSIRKRHSSGNFSLIIERVTNEFDENLKSIDWKMVFYDEFVRYADRFYSTKKSTPTRSKSIGGERFSINKWPTAKVNYFLTKNIFKRTAENEFEKQIELLY